MSKSEASGKTNIHIIKNKIQALDLKIKVMDIDHFHWHVNSLTNVLAAQVVIMSDIMHHFFKSYKV